METDRDDLVRRYGREIFARLDRRGPMVFSPAWLDDLLMQVSMSDENVKIQLFRFIDALPNLRDADEVSGHLKEYLSAAKDHLPWWGRLGVRMLPSGGLGGRLLARSADSNARRMARKFIAGTNVPEAIASITKLRKRSLAFTVDLLGEATITEEEAVQYQQQYFDLLDGLCRAAPTWPTVDRIDADPFGPIPRVNVSVKLSSLYSQFDAIAPEATSAAVRDRLRPILKMARRFGAFVNFDMEQYSFKAVTLRIFREILSEPEFQDWPDVGIAIQAYLKDTPGDLRDLCEWAKKRGTPVWIRLVKGAYWDFETITAKMYGWPIPVYEQKPETDVCYEQMTQFLLENYKVLRPAFASHNVRSVANALATADRLGIPQRGFEFQALYGMADPIADALVAMGQRVRMYTPYGQLLPGMAYLVRRLLENTSNESFLRMSFTDNTPEDVLLMNPSAKVSDRKPRKPVQADFVNEPLTDFAEESKRAAMLAGLKAVEAQLGRKYPLVIGGKRVETTNWLTSVNPSRTSQVVGLAARASAEQAKQAVEAARKAFDTWRDVPARERADYLFKMANLVRARTFEWAAWIVYESGKNWREADMEVGECIDFLEYYGKEMLRLSDWDRREIPGEDNTYVYEPRGVTVVIAPWNFPLAIITGMASAAIVTGNTVILKPAEQSPCIGAKIQELCEAVNLPPGVCNYLPGDGEEIGPTLVEHPDVAVIAFTGSQTVGTLINAQAARTPVGQDHVKKVIAEMGGKNATIIDSDADLDEAVKGVVDGAFGYTGQKCSACSRAIVHEKVYDAFVHRVVEATKSLKIAPSDDPTCNVGPLIDEDSRKRVLSYVEKGKAEAKLIYAGDPGPLKDQGTFVGPHVFSDVSPSAIIAQEEIFGPVVAVIKAKDFDDALAIANNVNYALTGAVYSRSPANIERAKRRFRVGNLYINRKCTGAYVCRQPFGGFKMSGIGSKAGGPEYLQQFMVPRTITENTMRRGFAPTTG
ncbi:MAG: L-glutamate gamma-semialdehyde dehydrogenase [Gemmataceae bacterium]|nr:L-glutamate gamma-semialdehyde dehydrogenase [Gemmataceae bacterium]